MASETASATPSLALRNQLLLSLVGGRSDRLSGFADEFEQAVVNKRLRWEESVVDSTQANLNKVARAVVAAVNDPSEANRDQALREIARFETGPMRGCAVVIETSFRETVECKKQLERAEREREASLGEIARLKKDLEQARSLPKEEVERLAKECNKLPSTTETARKRELLQEELERLKQQRQELKRIVELRKKGVQELAQAVETFRQSLAGEAD